MLDFWGLGGNFAQGTTTTNRAKVFAAAKSMGCTWVKDSIAWDDFEGTQGVLDATRVAKVQEAISQAADVGLKYFCAIVVDAPSWATGGGGGAYPTDATDFAAFRGEFDNFLDLLLTACALDAVTIGAEMSGPTYWLPDGLLANKTAGNLTAICAAYKSLYDDARTQAQTTRPAVIVVSSNGDLDFGYISNWATELAAQGFDPQAYCIYDYRYNSSLAPSPYLWGPPEDASVGDVHGNTQAHIQHYADLFPNADIIVSEAGYVHQGYRTGKPRISRRAHASLYARMAVYAAQAMPGGYFFHTDIDQSGSAAGVLNDDYTPRETFTALSQMLPHLSQVNNITSAGTVYRAFNAQGKQIARWDTSDDEFYFESEIGMLAEVGGDSVSRTFLQLCEAVAENAGVLEQGTATSGAGAGATLVAASWPFLTAETNANNSKYVGCEQKVTSGTTNLGATRGIITYAASTGTFTPSSAWPAQITTETFDIFLKRVAYDRLKRSVNEALRFLPGYRGIWPVTLVTDGDMETSGVANWTATNSTMTKVTGASTLLRGTQSGRVLNSAADGQVQSATILVQPGRNYRLYAPVRADVGTAELLAYDVTNSAEITSETYASRGWGLIDFTFTTPSTCEAIAVILRGQGASDDTYWDGVILSPTGADVLSLPTWVTERGQVLRVLTDRATTYVEDRNFEAVPGAWKVVEDWGNPNYPFSLQLQAEYRGPIWVEAVRPFSELSADTDTTFAPRELLEAAATWKLCEWMKKRSPGQESVEWSRELSKWRARTVALMRQAYGPRDIRMGFGETADVPGLSR